MRHRVARILSSITLLALNATTAHAIMPMHPDLEAELRSKGVYSQVVRQILAAKERGAFDDGYRPGGPLKKVEPGKKAVWNAIIILVDFDDHPATGNYDATEFEDLLTSTGTYPTGSMRDWFLEASYNQFSFTGDVVGWYRMPQDYSYYCNNDGISGTNDDNGFGAYPNNARKLYEDAVAAADPDVDYTDYRNGGNQVEGVFVVHSGGGAEATGSASDIWSHRSSGSFLTQDGVSTASYTFQPELLGANISTMGVYAHEFGHTLGLPDLYDIDGSSSGIGRWCMMAGGTWNNGGATPAHYSSWCKRFLGWSSATLLNTDQTGVVLTPATLSDDAVYMKGNNHLASEFLLLEVRERTGFDAFLPSEGLLVWHCDSGAGTNAAETCAVPAPSHPVVRLLQADGLCQLEAGTSSGNAGDPFPGTTNNTEIRALTNPSTRGYGGKKSGLVIENIVDLGTDVQFDVSFNEILQLNVPMDYATLDDALDLAGQDDEVRIQAGHMSNGRWRVFDGFRISGGWDPTYSTQDDQSPSVVDGGGALEAIFDVVGANTAFRLDNLIVQDGHGERTFTPDAYKGGAVYMVGGTFEATRTRFVDNQAGPNSIIGGLGGAMAFEGTDVTITDCEFDANFAQEGGAIHAIGGSVSLNNVSFTNHLHWTPPIEFEQRGGAILLEGASLTDVDGVYTGNTTDDGGAIYVTGGSVSLTGTTIQGNTALDDAGGLFLEGGDFTMSGATIDGNMAGGEGGGVFANNGLMDIRTSRITGNSSGTLGGGLYLGIGSAGSRLGSTVVANNTASIIAGGVLVSTGEMLVEHNTFHNNTGVVTSGNLQSTGASVWVRNNVFSSSVGTAYTFAGGTLNQLDHNIYWGTTNGVDLSGATLGANSLSSDPLMVDPAGGDFHLGAGSPAIDAGDPGQAADFDGSLPDMGAYAGADDDADRPGAPASPSRTELGNDTQLDWSYPGVGTTVAESHIFTSVAPKAPLQVGGGTLAVVAAPTTTYLHTNSSGEGYQIQLVDANGHAGSYTDVLDAPVALPPTLTFGVSEAYPNPFNPRTSIQLRLPTSSRVQAEVYDLAGRRVKVVTDEVFPAGNHVLTWNGTDGRGHSVASGSYVFRLSSAAGDATRRLLLIK